MVFLYQLLYALVSAVFLAFAVFHAMMKTCSLCLAEVHVSCCLCVLLEKAEEQIEMLQLSGSI